MSDLAFERILNETNQAYLEAKDRRGWVPPDGDYVIAIEEVKKGVSVKDGQESVWWKHKARILGGDGGDALIDRTFTSALMSSKAYGRAADNATVLNHGATPESTAEVDRILSGATGAVLRVKVETAPGWKDPNKMYTTIYYKELLADTTAPDGGHPATPPQS